MDSTIDEIKSKLDIVDVISEYIQLKPAGTSFKAVCPFHREKAPSFFVSPEKQIWHCFGCNKGGDIFGFVQEIEGVEFPEALRILAIKAGVKIKKYDRQSVSQNTKLLDISRLTAKFYHRILLESSLAEKVREYLKERGLNKKIITEFQLGFVPDKWDTLLKFLLKRGYKETNIEAAGLIVRKQTTRNKQQSNYYDRFRDRIMFPIFNIHGQVVGFTGRILPGSKDHDKSAKYINSPQTSIYNKSRVLYGLDKARLIAKQEEKLILVEGNMDVLACHQFGTKNVVCTSGTALTIEQIKLLQRYTKNIILAFDVDAAGQTATQRSIDLLLQEGLNVKVLDLPQGKDPDECIRKSPKAWLEAIKNPQPIMDYYFSSAFKGKNLNMIEDKKQITEILLPIIAKLGNPVEQGLWLKKLSDDIGLSEMVLRDGLKRVKLPRIPERKSKTETKEPVSREQQAAERFLGLILKYPKKGQPFLDKLILDMFITPQTQTLVKALKDCYIKDQKIKSDKIKQGLKDKDAVYYLDFLLFLAEKESAETDELDIEKELDNLFCILKRQYLSRKLEKVTLELKEAEKRGDKALVDKMTRRIVELSREIGSCERS